MSWFSHKALHIKLDLIKTDAQLQLSIYTTNVDPFPLINSFCYHKLIPNELHRLIACA